jgi:hypothetical protein
MVKSFRLTCSRHFHQAAISVKPLALENPRFSLSGLFDPSNLQNEQDANDEASFPGSHLNLEDA